MRYRWMDAAACALLCLTAAASAESGPCMLTVPVGGFRNQKGDLGVTTFETPEGWPEQNEKAFFHSGFPVTGKESLAQVSQPPGRYAIAILHDENLNHKLDRNSVGIPREGFGLSNNPKVMFSAPGFDTAVFDVVCPATDVRIYLIYKLRQETADRRSLQAIGRRSAISSAQPAAAQNESRRTLLVLPSSSVQYGSAIHEGFPCVLRLISQKN